MRALVIGVVIALAAAPAAAAGRTIHGVVYDDVNGDGLPSAGERGIAGAVVALDVRRFVVADASGQFELRVPDGTTSAIVWARVPDGFRPGPAFARWDAAKDGEVDIALHRLAHAPTQPLAFVVAADTHLSHKQESFGASDLAAAAAAATALDPAPAFFTVLGDITQGSAPADYDLVDAGLANLDVPWVPVPGNHDWYDDGEAWFRRYGPDNYSFDLAGVHFVVWNMAMTEDEIRAYLGDELSRVAKDMPIVALTHAPPSPAVIAALRELGVDYVLTGHAHSNRVVDHGGLVELNTEPMLMGGLDFTPAGYRVVMLDGGQLRSYHRTTVDGPLATVIAPARGTCAPARGGELVVAAEVDAGAAVVTARVDCASPIALAWAGGWDFRAPLPALAPGPHAITVEARSPTGAHAIARAMIEVCDAPAPARAGAPWPQLGGGPAHDGARDAELAPPLAIRWTAVAGGHVLAGAPAIAGDSVFVTTTDLGDGNAGGLVAFDLATGALRWRVPTPAPVRGAPAVVDGTVVIAQIDGVVVGVDAATGALRWRHELSLGVAPAAGAVFSAPAADAGDVLVGHQRALAALSSASGSPTWTVDPVPKGVDSQSLAAVAIGDGMVVGTFNRRFGGVAAWDRASGRELWRVEGEDIVAINTTPVIGDDTVYVVTGADEVIALELATGAVRWRVKLDAAGFAWGNATLGTPALARGVLVVPTLYRDAIALDAKSGAELWRRAGAPGPLRATHYRGAGEAGFEASPVITGNLVWLVDTAGELSARELDTGELAWRTRLDVPVLAGLATSGDWLIVASYDGSVHALARGGGAPLADTAAPACIDPTPPRSEDDEPHEAAGCCGASSGGASTLMLVVVVALATRRRRPR